MIAIDSGDSHQSNVIQDVSSKYGFCGSTIVNLFGKNSLVNLMDDLGYKLLKEDFEFRGDQKYFYKCENEKFRKITLTAYIFVRVN